MATFTNRTKNSGTTDTAGQPVGLLLALLKAAGSSAPTYTNRTKSSTTFTNRTKS